MGDAVAVEDIAAKKPPASVREEVEAALVLTLVVEDPDCVSELRKLAEGAARTKLALAALRIGVLALRQAQGQVDQQALREEGAHLLADLKRELETRVAELDRTVARTLKEYFDPLSGHFTERIERLIKKDGDLERVLRSQVGDSDNSELARTLAKRIGESSPLMRRLNPEESESVVVAMEASVSDVLAKEQEQVLAQFSLDNPQGALSRFIAQLEEKNGRFTGNLKDQIQEILGEFSLDDESSALSRLVKKVEDAKDQITEEFSLDNEDSAINKLNSALAETRNSIEQSLTLDNDSSALARLKRQLNDVLEDIRAKNEKFQQTVSSQLAALVAKREEAQRSTTHGLVFEEELCQFLQKEAQKAGDVFVATGNKAGVIPRCKKGDAVIELGPEAAASGEKIVFEAKDDKNYDLKEARQEIEEARQNREAEAGVFVFEKSRAPKGIAAFARIDKDIFVIWDASDSSTDIYLIAAYSLAKALLFKKNLTESKTKGDLDGIERALNAMEKHLESLSEMEKWTNTIQSNSTKVIKSLGALRTAAEEQMESLRDCLESIRASQQ